LHGGEVKEIKYYYTQFKTPFRQISDQLSHDYYKYEKNEKNLKNITSNSKEFAAASQLFNKEMGQPIDLAFLGSYPIKLPTDKIFNWGFKNFRK
jgi:hypothetical protein